MTLVDACSLLVARVRVVVCCEEKCGNCEVRRKNRLFCVKGSHKAWCPW
ncbi:hypothetical protein HMPREF9997_01604 [Corynebacterium durum F0235]|uniref:Uncharacterized protein n=1 Tax=Corynebacterium durum F0235 TaxID=1035195 RepID=L1MG28_9CORY|nr:hypothetical protein HMPREF9997_01604 [Corynebacterium durum F0235]